MPYHTPETFGILKQGKTTFGLGLGQHCVPKYGQQNKKTVIMTTGLMSTA